MLRPYAITPRRSTAPTIATDGNRCPMISAMPMFTAAAAPVFTETIANGSRTVSDWVTLLSIAHNPHAATTHVNPTSSPCTDGATLVSKIAPPNTKAAPSAATRGRCSPNNATREEQRERTFEIQEQGRDTSAHAIEADEQQHRRGDPAGHHDDGEPRQIARPQSGFCSTAAERHECGEHEERTEVEQPREQLRGHIVEQPFRDRCAGAEANCGGQPERDTVGAT